MKTAKTNIEINVSGKTEDIFVLVEASKLSLSDKFMKYKPKTAEERNFKELLTKAIKRGLSDFYRPKYDPSFRNEDSPEIEFVAGKRPAVGHSYNWWEKTAKEFKPERHSRLGTKFEYVAFLGVLIKKLVDNGWTIEKAWDAVCNDSKELGHYWNSENAQHCFENTGSREICGFCDLANTFKILAEDEEACGFWLAGGFYFHDSSFYPLADLEHNGNQGNDYDNSVGWLVLEEQH